MRYLECVEKEEARMNEEARERKEEQKRELTLQRIKAEEAKKKVHFY